ncbi:MAG: hypothetical protein FJ009_01395 [Chloroflexi bacterium]|nr:hypothetical protein [Chloroflexota bacterium]
MIADFFYAGNRLRLYPYLDSGADITILPYRFGAQLGLTSRGEPVIDFAGEGGGAVATIVKKVGIRIGSGVMVVARVGWAQTDAASLLLGRLDVFDHFTFEFNHLRKEIRVKQ